MVERLGRTAVKDDKVPEGLILSCEEDYALCLPFLEKGNLIFISYIKLFSSSKKKNIKLC